MLIEIFFAVIILWRYSREIKIIWVWDASMSPIMEIKSLVRAIFQAKIQIWTEKISKMTIDMGPNFLAVIVFWKYCRKIKVIWVWHLGISPILELKFLLKRNILSKNPIFDWKNLKNDNRHEPKIFLQ